MVSQRLGGQKKTIDIDKAIAEVEAGNVRFARLVTICGAFFGAPRIRGSHHIFSMPWPGDPRVNVQEDKGCDS